MTTPMCARATGLRNGRRVMSLAGGAFVAIVLAPGQDSFAAGVSDALSLVDDENDSFSFGPQIGVVRRGSDDALLLALYSRAYPSNVEPRLCDVRAPDASREVRK